MSTFHVSRRKILTEKDSLVCNIMEIGKIIFVIFLISKWGNGQELINAIGNLFEKDGTNVHCVSSISSESVDYQSLNLGNLQIPIFQVSINDEEGIKQSSKLCKNHIFLLRYYMSKTDFYTKLHKIDTFDRYSNFKMNFTS